MNHPSRPQDQVDEATKVVLLARAERLRDRPKEEDPEIFWAAEFPLGGEAYAFPLESLVACLPLRLVTQVPLSDSRLTGIVRFQRKLLGVMSLSGMLGSKGWRRDPTVLLVLKVGGERMTAVDCEEIPRSSSLPIQAVQQARQAAGEESVVTVPRPGREPLHLIDVPRLFSSLATGRFHGS